jgi:hypothetical protein
LRERDSIVEPIGGNEDGVTWPTHGNVGRCLASSWEPLIVRRQRIEPGLLCAMATADSLTAVKYMRLRRWV